MNLPSLHRLSLRAASTERIDETPIEDDFDELRVVLQRELDKPAGERVLEDADDAVYQRLLASVPVWRAYAELVRVSKTVPDVEGYDAKRAAQTAAINAAEARFNAAISASAGAGATPKDVLEYVVDLFTSHSDLFTREQTVLRLLEDATTWHNAARSGAFPTPPRAAIPNPRVRMREGSAEERRAYRDRRLRRSSPEPSPGQRAFEAERDAARQQELANRAELARLREAERVRLEEVVEATGRRARAAIQRDLREELARLQAGVENAERYIGFRRTERIVAEAVDGWVRDEGRGWLAASEQRNGSRWDLLIDPLTGVSQQPPPAVVVAEMRRALSEQMRLTKLADWPTLQTFCTEVASRLWLRQDQRGAFAASLYDQLKPAITSNLEDRPEFQACFEYAVATPRVEGELGRTPDRRADGSMVYIDTVGILRARIVEWLMQGGVRRVAQGFFAEGIVND